MPKPLLVILERNPNLIVLGADMPRLVLYDNGSLIYRWNDERCSQGYYLENKLDQTSFKKLKKSVGLTEEFKNLKSGYSLTGSTCLGSVSICIFEGELSKSVYTYGFMFRGKLI